MDRNSSFRYTKNRMSTEKEIVAFWNRAFEEIEPFAIKPSDIAAETDILSQEVFALGEKAHRIIDVGCGLGECLIALSVENGGKNDLFGLDGASSAIAIAKKSAELSKAKNILFQQGSLEALQKMPSASFDGALSSNFLDVVPLPFGKACLKEIARLLKPRGLFVLKINFYSDPSTLKRPRFAMDSEGLYIDGMFRSSNQTTETWLSILSEDFILLRQEEYPRLGMNAPKDRLFVLERK